MEKIIDALKNNELVSIEDVESGLACGCICSACKQNLVAKKGNVMGHHFAHASQTSCEYAYETSLHLLAKEIFKDFGYFMAPKIILKGYSPICIEDEKRILIKNVEEEKIIM